MAGSDPKTPAPKKDRIKGSSTNPKGSASSGKSKAVKFSAKVETSLKNKVAEHNEKAKDGRKATLGMLKAVYRRGAGAFSTSHRPGMTRDQWAMGRVNAFLKLLRSGKPSNSAYTTDNDLLPASHPRSTKKSASTLTASVEVDVDETDYEQELSITLGELEDYESPENAIIALAEFSGLGYEIIPALRASWLRAVREDEEPYSRARNLAEYTYDSKDADLLPHNEKGASS